MSKAKRKPELSRSLAELPHFLLVDLIEDENFMNEMGLTATPTTVVGPLRFTGEAFHVAVRQMLHSKPRRSELVDKDGVACVIEEAAASDGRKLLAVAAVGGERMFVNGMYLQSNDKQERLEELALELKFAGLPPNDCEAVRTILEQRPLTFDEQQLLENRLRVAPNAVMGQIFRELAKDEMDISVIVPSSPSYYEGLCGSGDALTVEELADNVTPVAVERLIAWSEIQGARMALALGGHPSLLRKSALVRLPQAQLLELADWALDGGDLLAKVGMVELGLELLSEIPSLSPLIERLVRQLMALDAKDAASPLNLINAMFVCALGEFSRINLLDDWPPFRRRQAALAHAALFARLAIGRVDIAGLSLDLFEKRSMRFYAQSVVDLRKEPRWLPDYANMAQLKDELLGRVFNAAGRFAANIADPNLRKLLIGKRKGSLAKAIRFPGSFFPGPMEGAPKEGRDVVPDNYQKILDDTLAADELTPGSVIALINTTSMFGVDRARVERAVEIIRSSGHRFMGEVDTEKRTSLIAGLVAVAASSRSVDLAHDVRIMLRKLRLDGLKPPQPYVELLLGTSAGAAFEDEGEWVNFVGGMANDLAFSVKDRSDALELDMTLSALCEAMPGLRMVAGKGLAALRAYHTSK